MRKSKFTEEHDTKDILYVRIDRRRKLLATILLKALGYSDKELLNYFYESEKIVFKEGKVFKYLRKSLQVGDRATEDIIDIESGKLIFKKDKRIRDVTLQKIQEANIELVPINLRDLEGKYTAQEITDPETGELLLTCNEELTAEKLK